MALVHTFSGSETIIWQSIKMSGTALETDLRIGAPITILGTKWPSMMSADSVILSTGTPHPRTHVQPVRAALYHALTFLIEAVSYTHLRAHET